MASKTRAWGQREFDFATSALEATGYLRALEVGIGALCGSMVALGVVVQFHPMGPHGLNHRLIHGLVLASAAAVGLWWLARPWPSHRAAIAFVVWADLSVVVCASMLSAPPAQLCATIHLGLIGVFAAFLLGWRILAAHCAFATAAVLGLTAWGVLGGHATLLDLYIYYAPALSSVVVLPIIIQSVIEAGRRMVGRTARHAVRDPLTGLFNRRGMERSVGVALGTRVTSTLMALAVVDLDCFKLLNDTLGHKAGDAALCEVARHLRDIIRHDGDLVARTGGDEFVLIANLDESSELDSFIDRCADLHRNSTLDISTSIGIAWQGIDEPDFDFDSLLRHADTAMYQAKRHGGNHLIVHNGVQPKTLDPS